MPFVTKLLALFVGVFFYFSISATAAIVETKTVEEIVAENVQLQAIVAEVGLGNYTEFSHWMSKHIKYRADRTPADEWKEPHTTLSDGTGDCEDYAILALEVLKRMGIQDVFLLGVANVKRSNGHVVCFFRENRDQAWQYYDFEKLKQGPKALEDLIRVVARSNRYGSNIGYLLADRDRKNLPPSDEKSFGLRD